MEFAEVPKQFGHPRKKEEEDMTTPDSFFSGSDVSWLVTIRLLLAPSSARGHRPLSSEDDLRLACRYLLM